MRKMMNKVAGNVKVTAAKAACLLKDKKGENYVDTAVKILIAVVIGALLLAGLYALFGDVVMPTLSTKINRKHQSGLCRQAADTVPVGNRHGTGNQL